MKNFLKNFDLSDALFIAGAVVVGVAYFGTLFAMKGMWTNIY